MDELERAALGLQVAADLIKEITGAEEIGAGPTGFKAHMLNKEKFGDLARGRDVQKTAADGWVKHFFELYGVTFFTYSKEGENSKKRGGRVNEGDTDREGSGEVPGL